MAPCRTGRAFGLLMRLGLSVSSVALLVCSCLPRLLDLRVGASSCTVSWDGLGVGCPLSLDICESPGPWFQRRFRLLPVGEQVRSAPWPAGGPWTPGGRRPAPCTLAQEQRALHVEG